MNAMKLLMGRTLIPPGLDSGEPMRNAISALTHRERGHVKTQSLDQAWSPEGTNSIAGGSAPGRRRPFDQPCKGLHKPSEIQPLQGWSERIRCPGALPPAIEFVPSGD